VSKESKPASVPRRGFFLNVLPAVLYVAAIFYGGSVPMNSLPGPEFSAKDKVLHALAFGAMQIAMLRAVRYELPSVSRERAIVIAFVLVGIAGGALELWQMHIPGRSAEFLDWVADLVGAGLVAFAIAKLGRRE
jgi:VanZ family protein